jgi:hypothetical protein
MGYLRYPGGKITVFTIANATVVSMTVHGLNDHGELIGNYADKTTGNVVGYIRYAAGFFFATRMVSTSPTTSPAQRQSSPQTSMTTALVLQLLEQCGWGVCFLWQAWGQYHDIRLPSE